METKNSFQHFLPIFFFCFLLAGSVKCTDVHVVKADQNLTTTLFDFSSMIASFGGPHPGKGVEFHVKVAGPHRNACDSIDPPPKDDNFWVVLIQRRGCFFVEKVRNAQDAGYHAAIIYNIGSNKLMRMNGNGTSDDISIPAFFIGQDDGVDLTIEYFQAQKQGEGLLLTFEAEAFIEPNDDDSKNIYFSAQEIYGISLGAVLLCVLLLFIIISCGKKYSIYRQNKRAIAWLSTIPSKKFKNGDPYETCAICFEDYVIGDELRLLYCSHVYHCKCIDCWLVDQQRRCPMCNRRVKTRQTTSV